MARSDVDVQRALGTHAARAARADDLTWIDAVREREEAPAESAQRTIESGRIGACHLPYPLETQCLEALGGFRARAPQVRYRQRRQPLAHLRGRHDRETVRFAKATGNFRDIARARDPDRRREAARGLLHGSFDSRADRCRIAEEARATRHVE